MSRALPLLAALALLLPGRAQAHNPDIATFVVVQGEAGWALRVRIPTAGLQRGLEALLGPTPSSDELREAAVQALRAGVELVADGHAVALGEAVGGVGSHEAVLDFALPGWPAAVARLYGTRLVVLADAPNQHNVLRLVDSKGTSQWVLAARNGFTLGPDVPMSSGSVPRPSPRGRPGSWPRRPPRSRGPSPTRRSASGPSGTRASRSRSRSRSWSRSRSRSRSRSPIRDGAGRSGAGRELARSQVRPTLSGTTLPRRWLVRQGVRKAR